MPKTLNNLACVTLSFFATGSLFTSAIGGAPAFVWVALALNLGAGSLNAWIVAKRLRGERKPEMGDGWREEFGG